MSSSWYSTAPRKRYAFEPSPEALAIRRAELEAEVAAKLSPVSAEVLEDPDAELTVVDTDGAEMLARRVLAIRADRDAKLELPEAEKATILRAAADMVAPIDEYINDVRARASVKEARLILALMSWHMTQRATINGRTVNATIPLPCGANLKSHKGQETVTVHDEDAAIAFLRELALANDTDPTEAPGLRHKPATLVLDKNDIKATFKSGAADGAPGPWVTADGQAIPGLEATPAAVTYTFDAKGVE